MPSRGYPVVDVFAGPGGLGEGFTSLYDGNQSPRFQSAISIESDEFAHQTLLLRTFLRLFPKDRFPPEYYLYLGGSIDLTDVYGSYPQQFAHAKNRALKIELCQENIAYVSSVIEQALAGRKDWVLIGGPPCQAYSLVGRSRMMRTSSFRYDERHYLYSLFVGILARQAPPIFVLENVKGLLSADTGEGLIFDKICEDLRSPSANQRTPVRDVGYRLFGLAEEGYEGRQSESRRFLVRSEEYGVPQSRHRIFIVGVRRDIDLNLGKLTKRTPTTLAQVIGSFPKIRSGLSRSTEDTSIWRNEISRLNPGGISLELNGFECLSELMDGLSRSLTSIGLNLERKSQDYSIFQRESTDLRDFLFDDRLTSLEGHESRTHMAADLRRFLFAATFAQVFGRSPLLGEYPVSLLPNHKNVDLARQGKMFSDRFRVQLPERPCSTITSHIAKDGHYYIHYDPSQCRSLTVREAARIQTFPDNFKFLGSRTAQYQQIGNAVPPFLANQIAKIVASGLDELTDN